MGESRCRERWTHRFASAANRIAGIAALFPAPTLTVMHRRSPALNAQNTAEMTLIIPILRKRYTSVNYDTREAFESSNCDVVPVFTRIARISELAM